MTVTVVRLSRSRNAAGELAVGLGVGLLDEYLEFLAGRCRPNTVLAVAYDLKVSFTVVGKPPRRVRPVDVLAFMTTQRTGGDGRLQIAAAGGGVSARTLRRRLSSVSGLYGFLLARGDVTVNPVPRVIPSAASGSVRARACRWSGCPGRTGTGRWSRRWCWRAAPLRGPRAEPGRSAVRGTAAQPAAPGHRGAPRPCADRPGGSSAAGQEPSAWSRGWTPAGASRALRTAKAAPKT